MFKFLKNLSPDEKIQTAYQIKLLCETGRWNKSVQIPYKSQIFAEIIHNKGKFFLAFDENDKRDTIASVYNWLDKEVLQQLESTESIKKAEKTLHNWQHKNIEEGLINNSGTLVDSGESLEEIIQAIKKKKISDEASENSAERKKTTNKKKRLFSSESNRVPIFRVGDFIRVHIKKTSKVHILEGVCLSRHFKTVGKLSGFLVLQVEEENGVVKHQIPARSILKINLLKKNRSRLRLSRVSGTVDSSQKVGKSAVLRSAWKNERTTRSGKTDKNN